MHQDSNSKSVGELTVEGPGDLKAGKGSQHEELQVLLSEVQTVREEAPLSGNIKVFWVCNRW